MRNYAKKDFKGRFEVMGDLAEDKFEQYAQSRNLIYERYGLERPAFRVFGNLPIFIRKTPDFIVEGMADQKYFVESKGTGGQVLKIKREDVFAINDWNRIMPVWFFIYDSNNDRYAFSDFDYMWKCCQASPMKEFENDKKEYYEITTRSFQWREFDGENNG